MRKILLASMFLSVFCCGTNSFAGTNDDIANACYATKKCGAKPKIKTMTAIPFTIAGAGLGGAGGLVVGTATPWVAGPGVGFVIGAGAGAYGGYLAGSKFGGYLAKAYSANEYLYFNDGTCLECDTYQVGEHYECPNGTIASNGSYFYKCRTELDGDFWEEYKPLPCGNSPIQDTSVKGAVYEVRATVDKRVKTGVYVYSGDVCLYITCGDGVLDKSKNQCVAKGGNDDGGNDGGNDDGGNGGNGGKKNEDEGGGNKKSTPTCRQSRTTAEGVACCDLPIDVATWDSKNKKCNCVDTNKQFSIVDGKGACIVPQAKVDDKYTCTSFDLSLINLWKTSCKDSLMVLQLIQEFETMCTNSNLTVAEYNKISNQVSLAVELNCQPKMEEVKKDVEEKKPDPNLQSRAAIVAAGAALDKVASGFEVNVWKNAEGEFNTARLASDSIAAVVLGTAGGLITSSVMKKHQVEDGFEDLKCTIGGQPVAGWGDEFRVGIQ